MTYTEDTRKNIEQDKAIQLAEVVESESKKSILRQWQHLSHPIEPKIGQIAQHAVRCGNPEHLERQHSQLFPNTT